MKVTIMRVALLATIGLACQIGRVPSDGDDADADAVGEVEGDETPPDFSLDCEDADLQTNPLHCGACNVICIGPHGYGECIDGECGDRFGSCVPDTLGLNTCTELCEYEGMSCSAYGCGGVTAMVWPHQDACVWSDNDSDTLLQIECDEDLEFGSEVGAASCCCSPS